MDKITWGPVDGKGRGVFALADIPMHDILETSPVNVISEADAETAALDHYNMAWRDGESCIGFGYLMLYNHSESPNCHLRRDFEAATISVIAKRDIKAGEELTYTYACSLWFKQAA